jgi:Flp pilus assembly protein TadD
MPDPTSPSEMSVDDYLLAAGRMLQEARPADALAALRKAELLDPEDAAVHFGLGGVHLNSHCYGQAAASLERAIALDPEFALAHYNLGMALQYLGQGEAAIAALGCAVALDPSLTDAYARLGDILDQHGRRADAIECFRRAAASAPDTRLGRLSHAKSLIAELRFADADARLRQAIALDPTDWPSHWVLGSMLSDTGRVDEAIECFNQTIALQPQYVGAYFSRVSAKRVTPDDQDLIDRMLHRLRQEGLTDHERMVLHFGLGKAFDDLRDYATAMRHFDIANQIRRGPQGPSDSAISAQVDRLIRHCSPQYTIHAMWTTRLRC